MLTTSRQKHVKGVFKWVCQSCTLFTGKFNAKIIKCCEILFHESPVVNIGQIRDFEYNSETQECRKQELEKLMQDQERFKSSLLQWCYTSYGEVTFSMKSFG